MPKTPAKHSVIYNPPALDSWVQQSGLGEIFDEFLNVTEGPADGRALVTICEYIQRTIKEHGFWSQIEPFNRWVFFIDEVLKNSANLQQNVGAHVYPERQEDEHGEPINLFRGKIKDFPISAMLSDEHQDPKLRVQYGSLHLHVVLARWVEAEKKSLKLEKAGAGKQLTLLEVLELGAITTTG